MCVHLCVSVCCLDKSYSKNSDKSPDVSACTQGVIMNGIRNEEIANEEVLNSRIYGRAAHRTPAKIRLP